MLNGNALRNLLAVFSTAVLAALSWPANGSLTPLLFGAFLPMLWLEDSIREGEGKRKGRRVFFYGWLAFGLFNLLTTWWVAYAHWSGTLATTLINGGLMAVCFWLFHMVARQMGRNRALLVLPFLWMLVEYLHMDWDMSFPWLNLGYAFSNRITWIQWYSYTGAWGGTLWILWVNAVLFMIWKDYLGKERWKALVIYASPIILLPIMLSYVMYVNYEEEGESIRVLVVQPNIDPYTTKFELTDEQTVDRFLTIATPYLDESVDYLIGPETMIGRGLNENRLGVHRGLRSLLAVGDSLPNLHTVIGASTYRVYQHEATATARPNRNGEGYYDSYNSSLHFTNFSGPIDVYHKSKLVVGVEKVPFAWLLQPILRDGIDLGGATGSLGDQDEREVFTHRNIDSLKVASVVCWEADFPGYTAEFVKNGANALFAITNDGWWSDTPGKDQHLHFTRARAIENRRSVARSANTGISAIINQRGDVMQRIEYGEQGALVGEIRVNQRITPFTEMGDFIGRLSVFISIATVLSVFVKRRTTRK